MNRNKALIIILIVAAVIIAALAFFYFYFINGTAQPGSGGTFPISGDNGATSGGASSGGQNTGTTGGQNAGAGGTGTSGGSPSGFENQPQTFKQNLRELSSVPVAGATIFDASAGTFVRYVERATGHIFEADTAKQDAPYRISNTTIPKVYQALWLGKGTGVILRYLKEGSDTVQTFYTGLKASATSTDQNLSGGTFLTDNITSLAVSPAGDKIFYTVDSGDMTYGIAALPNGSQKSQLFSSSVHEWIANWPVPSFITLTTKASSDVAGYTFELNTSTGGMQKELSAISGLTALANTDGSLILYSVSNSSGTKLKLYNASLGVTTDMSIDTLPEKCVWSVRNRAVVYCAAPNSLPTGLPDAWYQGSVTFADDIWKIDTKTGETDDILSPQSVANQEMDITNLELSSKEDQLLFQNKKDLSLWLLALGQ